MGAIKEFFSSGGEFMWPILAVSVVGIAIITERVARLFFRYSVNANQFMAQIKKLVISGNIDRAIKLCNAEPNAALPRVIKAGLTRANKGETEILSAIEEATLEVVPEITKRTPSLRSGCQRCNSSRPPRYHRWSDSGVRRGCNSTC